MKDEQQPQHGEKSDLPQDMLLFTKFAVDRFVDAAYLITEDSRIIYVNEAATESLGYTREEFLSLRIYELDPDLTIDTWPETWRLLKEAGRRGFESQHQKKDGTLVPVEVSSTLFVFEGVEYCCAFTRDITERKQLEQRVRRSDKMNAIGQLAGGVAHDFNNQLAGISGYADLLTEELKDNARALHFLDQIHLAVARSSDLTSQLLAFSRQGKYRSEAVNTHSIAKEVVSILKRSLDKRIRIATDLAAERTVVEGDPTQLQNAILNLAINARDAMPKGGTLTIATYTEELDQTFCDRQAFTLNPGLHVVIKVEDDGRGIEPDVLERIFEPFFTTKGKGEGTGLGLAAVYGTAKMHKGAVVVESELGRGTVVRLYLPLCADATRTPQVIPRSVTPPPRRKTHVLVVEDEPGLREIAQLMLRSLGCTVTLMPDGHAAVDFYRETMTPVDLVILDMCMPGIDGAETFRALRKINTNLNVLLASGYSVAGEAQELLNEGAKGFLQKPYRRGTLAEKLGEILDT